MQRSFILKKNEEIENEKKKLPEVEDMHKLDVILNDDIRKIRAQIDETSKIFLQAQKRFEKAEKEYLEAKVELFIKGEEKDRLADTLRGLIENNESEKAMKLSQLLSKFEIKSKSYRETVVNNEKK